MLKFGLIGKQLSHSFSSGFFTEKFNREKRNASYQNIELPTEISVRKWLESNHNFTGVNVTTPYKETVLPFMDELDGVAKEIGAINTIHFKKNHTIGYNTDAFGFHQSIKPFLEGHHHKALILGTGGAAKAVAYVLQQIGVSIYYLSRKSTDSNSTFTYDQANKFMVETFPLIINTTPIGMYPYTNESPDFPIEFVTPQHLVIDLIYNPSETVFLSKAKEQGAIILNGHTMLYQQALKAWEIWSS